jgi:hypothetical protein
MKRKLSSVFFLVIFLMLVLHSVLPHHDDEDILLHIHELNEQPGDGHAKHDNHPATCQVQSITLHVTKVVSVAKFIPPVDVFFRTGSSQYSTLDILDESTLAFSSNPVFRFPCDILLGDIPPRAPPC